MRACWFWASRLAASMAVGTWAMAGAGGVPSAAPAMTVQSNAPPAAVRLLVKLRSGAIHSATARAATATPPLHAARAGTLYAKPMVSVNALLTRHALLLSTARVITPTLQALTVSSTADESLADLLAKLRADPAVEYVEADQRRHINSTLPNDPLFLADGETGQWYLQNAGVAPSAIDAVDAWDISTGSDGLVIADIDTGVRFEHPDLLRAGAGGRLLPGYTFISDAFSANDADSWDADASDPGDWVTASDAQSAECISSGVGVQDSSWHGTRTAGLLGALSNNGLGIAGLTWHGWVLPVRVLGKCGGYDSDIEAGMLWAAGNHVDGAADNPYPARILNLSLGSKGTCPASYQDVIDALNAQGVTVIVSAGNDGGPVGAPANCVGALAVGGLTETGTKVAYSNLGPEVALSAPGGSCPNGPPCVYAIDTTTNLGSKVPLQSGYTNGLINAGTSFSAPLVAGVAGLMLSVNGNLGPALLLQRMQQSVAPFPVATGVPLCAVPAADDYSHTAECGCSVYTCGAGMVDAHAALLAALRPIAAFMVPATVTAGQSVTLDASGSTAACGRAIAGYSWSVVGGGADLSAASGSQVTLTAPASGVIEVQLTVTDDMGATDTAVVLVMSSSVSSTAPSSTGSNACLATVTPTLPPAVSVSPAGVRLPPRFGAQQFTASITGSAATTVTWAVNGIVGGNSMLGTVSGGGLYRAPASIPVTGAVTVTATTAGGASGFAGVLLSSPISVSITPASATVAVNGLRPFHATASNDVGDQIDWAVNGIPGGNSLVGTVTAGGLYRAPQRVPSPSSVTLSATARRAPYQPANAQINITPATSGSGGGAFDPLTLLLLTAGLLGRQVRATLRR